MSDESTLDTGPHDSLTGRSGIPRVPALTIIWHPDLQRVGEIAPLTNLLKNEIIHISREQPLFLPPSANDGTPLAHRRISRESVLHIAFHGGILELRRVQHKTDIEVDAKPFLETRRVSAEELGRGVIVTIARRVVLCLHSIAFPITRSPTLGLLGTGDAIENVRRAISRLAAKPTPVLLRGESGTGKELVARALHAAGPRAKGPFVAVNTGRLVRENAAAELFGHRKGSFTGATSDIPGHFRAAAGGTIFLDEVGYLPSDVQPMFLRVLEDKEVQPIGSSQSFKVDVRVIAATDANLEQLVVQQRLETSLYYRLISGVTISLPPLRNRREDVGTLLVHFLTEAFGSPNALERFQDPTPEARPWLSARDVAAVASSPLSGNVRRLASLARNLVEKAGDVPKGDTHSIVAEFLNSDTTAAPATERPAGPPASSTTPQPLEQSLLDALERANWNRTKAAQILGVGRTTFYRRLENHPDLRQVLDVEAEELERALAAAGGDVEAAAAKLGVSVPILRLRLGRRL
jgi:two-component system nitrogen regulation response regulator GlnG